MLRLKRQWLAVPVALGVAAFAACGVEEVDSPEAPPALEQARQELYVDLYTDVASPVVSGNVYGAANEFTPPLSCADGPGGSDLSFKWTAPATGSYTFNTVGTGSVLDSVLHIYTFSASSAGTLLDCNDNIDLANNILTSSVTLPNLAAGTQLRIVVDSYEPPSSRNGAFKLNIVANFPICPAKTCTTGDGQWTRSGCVYTNQAAGTACSDGKSCTANDTCDGNGTCRGTTACNSPPSTCHTGTCTDTGCVYTLKEAGEGCSDGMGCTRGDTCTSTGRCMGEDICSGGYACTVNGCQRFP